MEKDIFKMMALYASLTTEQKTVIWQTSIDENNVEAVAWQIECGDIDVNTKLGCGASGLCRAIAKNHYQAFTAILKANDIQLDDGDIYGNSSLHTASRAANPLYLQDILNRAKELKAENPAYRFNINQGNNQNFTGLILATAANLLTNVKLLLDFPGINPMIRTIPYNGYGTSHNALEIAEGKGYWDIASRLENYLGIADADHSMWPSRDRLFQHIKLAASKTEPLV